MRHDANPSPAPWKWDATLLDREGRKRDSAQCGSLWTLDDGTIVVRLGCIWERGFYLEARNRSRLTTGRSSPSMARARSAG